MWKDKVECNFITGYLIGIGLFFNIRYGIKG